AGQYTNAVTRAAAATIAPRTPATFSDSIPNIPRSFCDAQDRSSYFAMSTQERRARNKHEPRFHRKHDGVSNFALILQDGDSNVEFRPRQTRRQTRSAKQEGGATTGQKARATAEPD